VPGDVEVPINPPGTAERRIRALQANRAVKSTHQEEDLVLTFQRLTRSEDRGASGRNVCFLVNDNWDDFGFKTLFNLVYFDKKGNRKELGGTKIIRRGMTHGHVEVRGKFNRLGKNYASLGSDQKFYENIVSLGPKLAKELMECLRDCAWNREIYDSFSREEGFRQSLMRGLGESDVRKFADIVYRRAKLTTFEFDFVFPDSEGSRLQFEVTPNVLPPTNIHTIIGRNGVGKTWLIRSLIKRLCDGADSGPDVGTITFRSQGVDVSEMRFANLISMAFSAFDEVNFFTSKKGTRTGIRFSYIGLRRPVTGTGLSITKANVPMDQWPELDRRTELKSIEDLAREFLKSLLICLRSSKRKLWLDTMEILESDPLFSSMRLRDLPDSGEKGVEAKARKMFIEASAGHKAVLLGITRLVELVEERTLVLIDEPEAHLHPPLQASFIRALSSLLAVRNGVAILATHSPVMLQEVPRECVWLLFRDGVKTSCERPQIETFAENLGVLTREVFRLEVTESGYHTLLMKEARSVTTADQLFARFDGHLGTEGRAVGRSLMRHKSIEANEG